MQGRVHSIQSLGTVDGPGVRFVVFLQGCHLRCGCCHNPDTWDLNGGKLYSPEELVQKAVRCREYFGTDGGVTLSGGEPLLQAEFAREIFTLCQEQGINTCLDTSGSILNENVKDLLAVTDRVLLDWKYATDEEYRRYVGCGIDRPEAFLSYLNGRNIPTTLRQVIIPTLNDNAQSILALKAVRERFACVDGVELLPFRKICQTKYDSMNIPFAFGHLPQANPADVNKLKDLLV